MRHSFVDLIRQEFEKKEKISLNELYEIISNTKNVEISDEKLKHRIRSTIYSLKKGKEIISIKKGIYQKSQ